MLNVAQGNEIFVMGSQILQWYKRYCSMRSGTVHTTVHILS